MCPSTDVTRESVMGRLQDQDRAKIAHDVRAGATDTSIMDKYELSREELYSFYDDMVKEGRLAMSDLLGDLPPTPEPGLMLVEECPVCGTHNLVDSERCSSCGSTLPKHELKPPDEKPSTTKFEPANVGLNLPEDSPADGLTESNRHSEALQEEEVALFDEDATVDLDTVLDDFAGIGSAAQRAPEEDKTGSWAVVTSGIDILDIIESIPVGSDETGHKPEAPVDNTTDSATGQTELSLDELLDLASEFDKTGEWDDQVAESTTEPQQLDLDLDRTIALVHRENLLREKKRSPDDEATESEVTEVAVDGLVTLSSEIEIPESEKPTSSANTGEIPLDLQSSAVAEQQPENEFPEWTGDSDVKAEMRIEDADLDFLEKAGRSDDSVSGSSEDITLEKATFFEPTIRLDRSGDFGFSTRDDSASAEETLPDDDVDLDFTLVSDIKVPLPARTGVVSIEEPEPSVEPATAAESEFTFNLDDEEDELPDESEEAVALSFDGPEAEQASLPKETAVPAASVLTNVRDTQLLETLPLSVFAEELGSPVETPPPHERSGKLRLVATASVLLTLVSLGGVGFYSGYLTVPNGLLSDLPIIGGSEKATSPVKKEVKRAGLEKQILAAKEKPSQPAQGPREAVQSPLTKVAPGTGDKMAALPPESPGGESVGLHPRSGKAPQTRSAMGKKRTPEALPPVALAADLVEAVMNNNAERVVRLIDQGSDVNGRDAHGVTPLMPAAENGNESLVELLLKRGANPNAKDGKGNTALMLAAGKGHVAAVKALLNGGADPLEVNEEGQTALGRVYASGPTLFVPVRACREIVTLIKEHGERQATARERK
jgi:hypothetical protein